MMAKQSWDKVSTVHILPGELTATVYWHTISYNPPVPCWTYITQGLSAYQQKELGITIKRDGTTDDDEAPGFVSELLMYIFALAKQGRTVDAGGYTSLTLTDKEKKVGIPFNLLYLNPIPIGGIPLPSPALTVRFMGVEEYKFYQTFGSTRLIATWAQQYRYFPAPPWSEFPAPKGVSVERFQDSILNKAARAHLTQSTVNLESKTIVFRLRPEARAALAQQLKQIPPSLPIAFLPNLDPQADASFAWIPEQSRLTVNLTPASKQKRVAGSFMLFIPEQQTAITRIYEDGFALLLPTELWEDIRKAMVKGESKKVDTPQISWQMVYI